MRELNSSKKFGKHTFHIKCLSNTEVKKKLTFFSLLLWLACVVCERLSFGSFIWITWQFELSFPRCMTASKNVFCYIIVLQVQELVQMGALLDFLIDHQSEISQRDLKLWAAQIAWGMMYLEKKRFVHRDLATRNILMSTKQQVRKWPLSEKSWIRTPLSQGCQL